MTFEFSSNGPVDCNTGITVGPKVETVIESDDDFLRSCGIDIKGE